ncbi:alpha/beta hydrolase family protein [Aliikangiella coralliicola]|uniref:S9 family peptidase n=1 Tax=Aliikangiella coralliicola TaxID=2592383 RepID=A0A545UIR6_9GAMM|nr:S9 family peptidase [Aliikangiella coralliicola]TQV89361.1 S9 family peptidase [Aliikangiella coralliicola]
MNTFNKFPMFAAFFCLLILFCSSSLISASELPIEYFAEPSKSRDVKISPDGKHLAVILNKNGKDVLAILDRNTRKPLSAFGVKGSGRGVGYFDWVSDSRLIYAVTESYSWDKAIRLNGELFGVNIDGSQHKIIFGYRSEDVKPGSRLNQDKAEYGSHEIIDMLKEDEKHILISFFPWREMGLYYAHDSRVIPTVYRLNVYSGKKRKVISLAKPGAEGITDNNGEVRFSISVDDDNHQVVSYREPGSDSWKNFSLKNFEGTNATPVSFSEDNKSVYFSANVKGGTRGLYLFHLETKQFEKLFHSEAADVSQYVMDFAGRRVVAVGTDLDVPEYHYIDKKDKKSKLHKMLKKAFAGNDIVITSATDDGSALIVLAYADNSPGDYFLFDTKSMGADHVLGTRDWIDPALMATTEPMKFEMRDGLVIQGFLTKPQVAKKQKLPLVVLPHGGPHSRDFWGFDWEVQLLANRGYAVLQLNFRGSTGYGQKFEEMGHKNWGTSMQDDITDATLALIKQGIVDLEKICIFGHSYGGYAAVMGTVKEPDLFQCAVGSVGVYDLPMMYTEGDIPGNKSGLAYLNKTLGSDMDELKRRSPVYNVGKIKADLLLIHGLQDKRVPIEQAASLKNALDKIGKKYEWLELRNEGHGYYDVKNRVRIFKKILAFLDKNIGDSSARQSASK